MGFHPPYACPKRQAEQNALTSCEEGPLGLRSSPSACYPASIRRFDLRARSVADFSCPQAAMMSSPRGVRIGLA